MDWLMSGLSLVLGHSPADISTETPGCQPDSSFCQFLNSKFWALWQCQDIRPPFSAHPWCLPSKSANSLRNFFKKSSRDDAPYLKVFSFSTGSWLLKFCPCWLLSEVLKQLCVSVWVSMGAYASDLIFTLFSKGILVWHKSVCLDHNQKSTSTHFLKE